PALVPYLALGLPALRFSAVLDPRHAADGHAGQHGRARVRSRVSSPRERLHRMCRLGWFAKQEAQQNSEGRQVTTSPGSLGSFSLARLSTQGILGPFQHSFLRRAEAFPATVDIKIDHRHGRPVGAGLAGMAAARRSEHRTRDLVGIVAGEHALFQVHGVALAGHPAGPIALAAAWSFLASGTGATG